MNLGRAIATKTQEQEITPTRSYNRPKVPHQPRLRSELRTGIKSANRNDEKQQTKTIREILMAGLKQASAKRAAMVLGAVAILFASFSSFAEGAGVGDSGSAAGSAPSGGAAAGGAAAGGITTGTAVALGLVGAGI